MQSKTFLGSATTYPEWEIHFCPFQTLTYCPVCAPYRLDGDVATVGITAHAAGALGDIVYVDLPSVGAKYSAGDTFGSVESVKAASDVYAPVAGEVLEVNSVLEETPGKVNESPIEGGWFIKLKVSAAGKADFAKLLDEKAYKQMCDEDKH